MNTKLFFSVAVATHLVLGSSYAQAQAAQPVIYAYCGGGSGARNITANTKTTLYISDVFDLPSASQGAMRIAFRQYLVDKDKAASSPTCVFKASQQEAIADKQSSLAKMQAGLKASGITNSLQIVETGWKYQASSAATASTPTSSIQKSTPTPAPANVTNTSSVTSATVGSPAQSVTSMGNGLAATGANIQQATMQSVSQASQNVQNAAAATVGTTVDAATQKMTSTIQNGMTNLFNRKKAPAAAVATNAVPAPPPARPETTSTVLPASYGLAPAAGVATNVPVTPVSTSSAKPIIQDEGDGKHWMLTIPGDPETHELTPLANSKTVFIEDSTGDKYILMPDGEVKHIPHKNVAK